jgi:hypothetical protein
MKFGHNYTHVREFVSILKIWLGIIAMRTFGKLNEKHTAICVGVGKGAVLFYLTIT